MGVHAYDAYILEAARSFGIRDAPVGRSHPSEREEARLFAVELDP
jgi:hypothetical protein